MVTGLCRRYILHDELNVRRIINSIITRADSKNYNSREKALIKPIILVILVIEKPCDVAVGIGNGKHGMVICFLVHQFPV
jgi:hypothetical protein